MNKYSLSSLYSFIFSILFYFTPVFSATTSPSVNIPSPINSLPLSSTHSTIISGIDYSSGDYGLKHQTDMLYLPLVFKQHVNNWDFALTLAYIKITGPGGVYGAGDGGVIPGGTNAKTITTSAASMSRDKPKNTNNKATNKRIMTNDGLADALFKVTYELDMYLQLPFLLELSGQVKLPLADEKKQLGTGEFDWSLAVDLAYSIDSLSPFITLGYKLMGDPDTINLDNIYFASLGLDYQLLPNLHSGIIYDYKQKVFADSYDVSESTLYLSWTIDKRLSINGYLVKGFSHGSPDIATGLQFSLSL